MKNLFLLLLTFFLVVSCNQDETIDQNEKEQLLSTLTFKNDADAQSKGGVNVVIFSVYIGRASQNCQSGWGFCNFEWFPKQGSNVHNAAKQSDTNGDYFEIHFANEIPFGLTDADLKMTVEDALSTTTNQGEVFTINAGEYDVDRSLGEFGGYRVYLD